MGENEPQSHLTEKENMEFWSIVMANSTPDNSESKIKPSLFRKLLLGLGFVGLFSATVAVSNHMSDPEVQFNNKLEDVVEHNRDAVFETDITTSNGTRYSFQGNVDMFAFAGQAPHSFSVSTTGRALVTKKADKQSAPDSMEDFTNDLELTCFTARKLGLQVMRTALEAGIEHVNFGYHDSESTGDEAQDSMSIVVPSVTINGERRFTNQCNLLDLF